MANRTIAPGGGNINVAATFVEVAVPTSADVIIGNTASGQLTVNVNTIVQRVNFTDYTDVLTINSTNTLTLQLSASASFFGAAMTYNFLGTGTTQGRLVKGNVQTDITMLGTTPIPCLDSGVSSTFLVARNSDIFVENFVHRASFPLACVPAGFEMKISGSLLNLNRAAFRSSSSSVIRMVGSGTIFFNAIQNTSGDGIQFTFIIDTVGTYTILNGGLTFGFPFAPANSATAFNTGKFIHLSGTIINPSFVFFFQTLTQTATNNEFTLDLIAGTKWSVVSFHANRFTLPNYKINFLGTPQFDNFTFTIVELASNLYGELVKIILAGSNFSIENLQIINKLMINDPGSALRSLVCLSAIDLILSPTQSMTINGSIDINGGLSYAGINPIQTPNTEIKSLLPGTQSTIILNTFTQSVSRARFTDIAVSGNTLFGQGLTLSNTTNIQELTLPPSGGGGGGGGSFVYLT